MVNTANNEDFGNNEGKIIINKHKDKTLHTLEILMTQLNMMFYWENINYQFKQKIPTLDELSKLMSRCLKLYQMIDSFMKIFELIHKLEVSISNFIYFFYLEIER